VWPTLFSVKATDWIAQPTLSEEIFGPFGLIVTVDSDEQMLDVAQSFVGQLTATMHLTDDDLPLAKSLTPILQQKAGRILVNGFPTGVEVCDAMVHSGPYPASTNFGATSVGTLAIRRFLRPVCFQNMPDALLPADWQQDV
jgi:NADP-dependent aldehyde dehydrogenase